MTQISVISGVVSGVAAGSVRPQRTIEGRAEKLATYSMAFSSATSSGRELRWIFPSSRPPCTATIRLIASASGSASGRSSPDSARFASPARRASSHRPRLAETACLASTTAVEGAKVLNDEPGPISQAVKSSQTAQHRPLSRRGVLRMERRDGLEQVALAVEVVIELRGADAGGRLDIVQARGRQAPRQEELAGRLHDPFASAQPLRGELSGLGSHKSPGVSVVSGRSCLQRGRAIPRLVPGSRWR
jgi:hypothetical protein